METAPQPDEEPDVARQTPPILRLVRFVEFERDDFADNLPLGWDDREIPFGEAT